MFKRVRKLSARQRGMVLGFGFLLIAAVYIVVIYNAIHDIAVHQKKRIRRQS